MFVSCDIYLIKISLSFMHKQFDRVSNKLLKSLLETLSKFIKNYMEAFSGVCIEFI